MEAQWIPPFRIPRFLKRSKVNLASTMKEMSLLRLQRLRENVKQTKKMMRMNLKKRKKVKMTLRLHLLF